jgi:hypothetical protein
MTIPDHFIRTNDLTSILRTIPMSAGVSSAYVVVFLGTQSCFSDEFETSQLTDMNLISCLDI